MNNSFWSNYIQSNGTQRFESLIRPLQIPPVHFQRAKQKDIPFLLAFLERHFQPSTNHPLLRPVLDPEHEIILFVQEHGQIIASIRYKYAGQFEQKSIHLIDCFCTHPAKRGSGLATKLLSALHTYTNDRQLRYSLFLKEGRPLPNHSPLYSSHYVYRRSSGDLKPPLSPLRAEALVAAYRRFHPDTVWLYDRRNTNQHWLFWKEGLEWILLCVQNAYQTHQGLRIGWITACFASEPIRSEPFEALVNQAPYDWIWMDRVWLPEGHHHWTSDGPFHWYAYQWSTCLQVKRFYGLVV